MKNNADKTINELNTIDSLSEADTIPIWDDSVGGGNTKKVPVGMIKDEMKPEIVTLWEGNYYKASDGSVELLDSIDNYDMIIVSGKMYYDSDITGRQVVTQCIPRPLYYYSSRNGGAPEEEFTLIGITSGSTTRRILFGFSPANPRMLYTGNIEGTSGHLPRLTGVYGIK